MPRVIAVRSLGKSEAGSARYGPYRCERRMPCRDLLRLSDGVASATASTTSSLTDHCTDSSVPPCCDNRCGAESCSKEGFQAGWCGRFKRRRCDACDGRCTRARSEVMIAAGAHPRLSHSPRHWCAATTHAWRYLAQGAVSHMTPRRIHTGRRHRDYRQVQRYKTQAHKSRKDHLCGVAKGRVAGSTPHNG